MKNTNRNILDIGLAEDIERHIFHEERAASFAQTFYAIERERNYQDEKWGDLEEHPHTVGEWLLVLESELNEAKQGWVKEGGDETALREILQVAAVAVACLQQHGIHERIHIPLYEGG